MTDFTPDALELIAHILSNRGFVIDEDPCGFRQSYTNFGEAVVAAEELLREKGYDGGKLISWSTGFRGANPCYGAVDSDADVDNALMDGFCDLSDRQRWSVVSLTFANAIQLHLDPVFGCAVCRRTARTSIFKRSQRTPNSPILQAKGKCQTCDAKGATVQSLYCRLTKRNIG